ncbi:cytochrome c maturation protein CcmE domain-containing protein [Fulvivirga sediminis]|uniref:Cytochrome c maturation protein CcmE n=1 Tax=Fulvivirga sediminis TaxID=2803949 RepID=A0A937JZV1_9BACT|nr:cytochrome c maturation protein CcmE [Fulvivirga sediminis]MBL3654822.1 cytochrome c maturation protein CcmE [Fulvivirga sediminis]
MKASHIIGIIVIAVAIGIIIVTAGDASSYVTFDQAKEMADNGNNNSIHVVGELPKTGSGEITGIEPSSDKLSFSFVMVDENKKEQRVFYNEPMPTDFKRSEKVVVIGSYKENLFIADKILMKCPSKYQEKTVTAGI